MKLIELLLCLVLVSGSAFAQLSKMEVVGKPKKLSDEIVAVRDANGRFCAGIQVLSDMDGFKYDSYNGVVRVDDNPGKDMVFLSPDERVLEIYKTGYGPLKIILSEVGIRLKEKTVWSIKLTGEAKMDIIPVSILVNPSDAEIFINGIPKGKGPTFKIAKGKHKVMVIKDGYSTVESEINVDENNALFNFKLEEKEDVSVQITSLPDGAKVTIDGVYIGMTPIAFFFPEGEYPIRLEKEGYLARDAKIAIKGPRVNESYSLDDNAAWLTVNTYDNAKVFINGKEYKDRQKIRLRPMLARVKVTLPKAPALEKQVALKQNQHQTLDLFPDVPKGTLQIAVTPFDSKIELKGDGGEYYTANSNKIFKDIPAGTYEVTVSRAGYQPTIKRVRLVAGDKVSQQFTLESGSAQRNNDRARTTPGPGPVRTSGGMVFVDGGTFINAAGQEARVRGFYISPHEVTFAEYDAYAEAVGESKPNDMSYGRGNRPVIKVHWYAALAYCNWLSRKEGLTPTYTIDGQNVTCNFQANGYRLPTRLEWEFAARGGNRSGGYEFSGSNDANEVAWNMNNSLGKSQPVGSKKPNELGIYDMSGNVWEWCWDDYTGSTEPGITLTQAKPSAPKVVKGGGWPGFPRDSKVSNEQKYMPFEMYSHLGFRVVRSR